MNHERPVAFRNLDGELLHGILHVPEPRVLSPVGVILLSPGQKCRIGPWRSYVQLARRVATLGVPVLRFDYHGLGDSEGAHASGQPLVDFNGFVQTGGLSRDVIAAASFFGSEAGVTRFVFAGLCGGASTGLIASQHIPGVYGHVLVDLPVTVSNAARQRYLESNAAEMLRLRPEESRGVLKQYMERLRDPNAWRRLLTGASDYALIIEAIKRVTLRAGNELLSRAPSWVRDRVKNNDSGEPATRSPPGSRPLGADEEVNSVVVQAFHAARAQRQKIFFLNSSAYHPMFERYFGMTHLADRERMSGVGVLAIPESNHILSAEHAQRALFECVDEFVRHAIAESSGRTQIGLHGSSAGAER